MPCPLRQRRHDQERHQIVSDTRQPDWAEEIAMPPAKGRSPEDDASQTTVTLKHMAAELADGHNLSNKQAEALLDDLMTLAIRHIKNGHRVRLTGFGTLHVERAQPQRGLNLRTGEMIEIRGKGEIVFRPSKQLKAVI
jgi:DNA-binding protein HU-beta